VVGGKGSGWPKMSSKLLALPPKPKPVEVSTNPIPTVASPSTVKRYDLGGGDFLEEVK